MPRNGAGTFQNVPGTTVTANTTIQSAWANGFTGDVQTTFNTAWPVSLGGTGGTSVITSFDALATAGASVATAGTLVLSTVTGPLIDLTGTTTVTAVTLNTGQIRITRATGNFQITVGASLIGNAGGTNIAVKTGDLIIWEGYAGSIVQFWVIPVSGQPLVLSANSNVALAASIAANALTISLKGANGTDPSASNIVNIQFRDVVPATGTPVSLSVTAATSLVISSGSTMGFANAIAGRLWIVGFNDAGTFRLGAVNCLLGTNIMTLRSGIYSSTAEGGAGGADSAQVIYTGTAVASKAMTVLGYLEATEATAGTWATAPSLLKLVQLGDPLPGDTVQVQSTGVSAVATGTTQIPNDNTIPQNTEGDQYMSQAITPVSATNVLEVTAHAFVSSSASPYMAMALFQDSVASAMAVTDASIVTALNTVQLAMVHYLQSGLTAATTFKIRIGGGGAGTTTFGGASGVRFYGAIPFARITVKEIIA